MLVRTRINSVFQGLRTSRGAIFHARSLHAQLPVAGVRTSPLCSFPAFQSVRIPTVSGARALSEISIEFVHPEVARSMVDKEGALLLDVRGEREFQTGAPQGAVSIPHDDPDLTEMVEDLTDSNFDKPIVVYDKVGARAETAKKILTKAGHTNVVNLGGMNEVEAFVKLSFAQPAV